MIISILHGEDKEIQHELDKSHIVIGRSTSCDIAIKSDNISRRHLEIKSEDGKILIKDVSERNWVSYDNDQLSKEVFVQYFDFIDLILPDDYQLIIKDPASADRREQTDMRTISHTNIIKPKPKRKPRKIIQAPDEEVVEKSKFEENKNLIIGGVVFVIAIATLVYFKFM